MIPLKVTQDQLLHSTLPRANGLRHMLCFVRNPDIAHLLDPAQSIRRVEVLSSLGPGVTSHGRIIHGGMITTTVDECMGALHDINGLLEKTHPAYKLKQNLTASIDVRFLKSVRIGDVVAESWIENIEDMKIIMYCEIRNKEDVVLAKATGTWITPKKSRF